MLLFKTTVLIGIRLIIMTSLCLAACSSPGQESREMEETGYPIPQRFPSLTPESPSNTSTASPSPSSSAAGSSTPARNPASFISSDRIFHFLTDLTSIRPYLGWRNSSSLGEREALNYVSRSLNNLTYLNEMGLETELETFNTFLGVDFWESSLEITINGETSRVLASSLRGSRDSIQDALRFDSDGALNDSNRNPIIVDGDVSLVRSSSELNNLAPTVVNSHLVFADYSLFDPLVTQTALQNALSLVQKQPAGIVLVTQYSNTAGESHGTHVGEGGVFTSQKTTDRVPILHLRLEDLAPLGISRFEDIKTIQHARLTWDADVFSPAESANLLVRIPGEDSSRAVLLSAHIDSANSPGALDDGSGSSILLEIAHVLDNARVLPPTDIYLVWFGSEELGLFGSAHFAATHSELLDKMIGMLQIDCLSHPLDNVDAELSLISWPSPAQNGQNNPWSSRLASLVLNEGIQANPANLQWIASDNSSLAGFDVPNAVLIYEGNEMDALGGVWYAGHLHDPYDDIELAWAEEEVFIQMTRIALAAVLDASTEASESGIQEFRSAPPPEHRIVFVGSHTEAAHMTPAAFIEFGMWMAAKGFDLDMVAYDQPVSQADLQDADLVVALPVIDYPSEMSVPHSYDESWESGEINILKEYVNRGGILMITNSAKRLKYLNLTYESNEDWSDMQDLSEVFGIHWSTPETSNAAIQIIPGHPLTGGLNNLTPAHQNWVPFTATGQTLAFIGHDPLISITDYGSEGGQVIVLGDLGLFNNPPGNQTNNTFWENLADFVRTR